MYVICIYLYLSTCRNYHRYECTKCHVQRCARVFCTALMCVYTLSQPTPPILNFTLLSLVPIHLQDHDDSTKY